ncbi:Crp/Fnr family transcriptional regulator [Dehalobacter sp. 12DCB1]|uniref:Crp/Fnr family transcriptional regulator n=1 Tax=Dehalobacter sp. 12DCB1 TaxID=2070364 RepID=UPI0010458F92|nr:Crp/Fnr family transcriptional regulator [Dehalobacter sp. 12DCB1]TCX50765.1 Crp/Fnr family transcriptional regulator [Dehalobacter sp. 12DCB1]
MEEDLKKLDVVVPDTFFPVEKLVKYTHLGSVKTYPKGSTVVFPGDRMLTLGYVIYGRLKINLFIEDEREKLMYFAGKYCILSLLFTEFSGIYAVATEDSQVCFFTEQQIRQIFCIDDDIVIDVLKNYQSKINYYVKQVTEMDYFNPTVRVVRLLYKLCLASGIEVNDCIEINIDLSMKDISEITGTHYVTVSKVLGWLRRQNILEKKKSKIIIRDLPKLYMLTHETHVLEVAHEKRIRQLKNRKQ